MGSMRAQRLTIDRRRARLLELGLSLFGQRAYADVSTDDIALAGGVSKGLLYHYFANKRGYYVATVRELAQRVIEATTLPEGVPFDQAVRVALERFVACIRENATFYRTLIRGTGVDDEVHEILETARHTLVRRVLDHAGIHEAAPVQRIAFFGWAGFVESTCLCWLDHESEVSQAELVDMMLGALLLLVAHANPRRPSN